ncbi:MAG TPA: hypothetical protein P5022_16005 [Candidatus Paceibacterota bacterium]|nr:hypothetical protein [Verrucomicrobiota bacterium]HRZ94412.1 hypothetical protein [Candidatus Paceibacterota bacterium]
MIHNRYLPLWAHRLCNGVAGALVLLAGGSFWLDEPAGSWRHTFSRCLILSSIPAGILLAWAAKRFSIIEGVAGKDGYDELDEPDEKKPPA